MANDLLKKKLFATTLLAGVAGGMWTGAAIAQDAPDEDDAVAVIEEVDEEDEARQERIVVTGSRLSRNEFTSASPLKVLNIEESVAAGLVDTATIVQRTSVAGGTQFDSTFTGQVTDSGPGASTVSLRGLDAERTLILSNGRRLAPAGVQGAPTRPDLNLIPLGMIERVDVLTDGASSIYGADAVAGVINFITRKDFDGLEIDAFYSSPEAGGGEERRISLATGIQSDRGFASFGFEYYNRDEVRRGERDFSPCLRDIEFNPDTGERREVCTNGFFSNQFLNLNFTTFGFDFDNVGEVSRFIQLPDSTATTVNTRDFVYLDQYNGNATSDQFALAQGIDRYSFFTTGEYNIDQFGDATFYYEGLYANRSQEFFTGASQAFPTVECTNPFVARNPDLATVCETAPLGQLIWLPRLVDQQGPFIVDVSTARGVAGVRGNLEDVIPTGSVKMGGDQFGINLGNWTYDLWASFDNNTGLNRQNLINADRFAAAIRTTRLDDDGNIVCGFDNRNGDRFGAIPPDNCVPIDVADPNVFLTGTLPQDAFDYVAGLSQTTTTIQQQMLQGSIAGDLFYVPAGVVPVSMGFEYRKDSIETLNDFLVSSGANTNGAEEGNTIGSTSVLEAFFETEIPILKGQPLAEDLYVNLSARWTEEENFGALWTYRVQGVYQPTDWLTGRASFGTTFRAPNLREQFLAAQVGFFSAFADPCVNVNFQNLVDNGDPADVARVLNNCTLQNADPTALGVGGAVTPRVITGGTTRLRAETSDAFTAGFVVEQPWFDNFDLDLAVTYFRFEIEDSIEEPSTGFILNECINESDNLSSPFCQLIVRDTNADPTLNFINFVDSSFVNTGLIETDGIDVDIRYEQDFVIGGNELTLSSNLSASNIMKSQRELFNITESFDGRPNLPHWRGDLQTQLSWRDWTLNWNATYVGQTQDDDIDALRANDILDENGNVFFAAGFRDVEETDEQFLHDLSIGYDADTWSVLVGVRNVLDQEPELVDEGEGYFTSANVVLGQGYDVFGRTAFVRVQKSF
ncbi:MAG: TonB-dependent receptor [Pseudomonadota bacterium]